MASQTHLMSLLMSFPTLLEWSESVLEKHFSSPTTNVKREATRELKNLPFFDWKASNFAVQLADANLSTRLFF